MALSTILATLKTTLQGVSGVSAANVYAPAPETPPSGTALPAIVADLQPFRIVPSTMSVWEYPIDVYYLHAIRSGDIGADVSATVQDKPKAIVDVLNAATTLGGRVYGMHFDDPAGEIGVIDWRDKTYVGAVLHLRLKEKYATSFSG